MNGRRSVTWVVIALFVVFAFYQFFSDHRGYFPADLGERTWRPELLILYYLVNRAFWCTLLSGLIYVFLHYRRRPLNLFLMILQLTVLLMAFVLYGETSKYVILAWMMLLTVFSQSRGKRPVPAPRDDVLDDLG